MPPIPLLDDSVVPVFSPVSDQTRGIADLFWLTLAIAMVIVMLVSGLVIAAGIKYRRIGNDKTEPRQVSGNLRMEIIWTATPAVILIAIFIPTIMVMNKADPAAPKNQRPDVEVIGHQYWWEYRMPKEQQGSQPLVMANELHIPVGTSVYTELESGDVNHDFWVPQLVRKIDVIKGNRTHLMIKADKVGYYAGHCAEYCGTQHAWMNIAVYVDTQADYDKWLQNQKSIPQPPATDQQLLNGQRVFLGNTCVNCHAIGGTTAIAQVGPNLTHLGGRKMIGSGISENTPANLSSWIRNAQAVKPGIRMPAYPQLSDRDLQDLTNYLESLK